MPSLKLRSLYLSSTYFGNCESMGDIDAFVIYVIHVTRQQSRQFNNIRERKMETPKVAR